MARMSSNAEIPITDFVDSSQLTNWVLDQGVNCHMTPETLNYVPGSLVETYTYIGVSYGRFVASRKTVGVQIKMRGNDVKPFISTLYNVLFSSDL